MKASWIPGSSSGTLHRKATNESNIASHRYLPTYLPIIKERKCATTLVVMIVAVDTSCNNIGLNDARYNYIGYR